MDCVDFGIESPVTGGVRSVVLAHVSVIPLLVGDEGFASTLSLARWPAYPPGFLASPENGGITVGDAVELMVMHPDDAAWSESAVSDVVRRPPLEARLGQDCLPAGGLAELSAPRRIAHSG